MLAGVAAKAVTHQIPNLAILILELNGIGLRPLHDGIPLCAVQTEVTNPVFHVVVVPPFRNGIADVHLLQAVQMEGRAVTAAGVFLIIRGRCLEPCGQLRCRNNGWVEGQEVGAGDVQLPVDMGYPPGQ